MSDSNLASWNHGMMTTTAAKTGPPLKLLTRVGLSGNGRSNSISSTSPGFQNVTTKPSAKLRSQSVSETPTTGVGKAVNSTRYKTELCRPFMETNSCKYGEKCQFAHGRLDLREMPRHPKYKTEYCRTYHTQGFCPYGPRCHFIHTNSGTVPATVEVSDSEVFGFSSSIDVPPSTTGSASGSDSPASFSPSGGCPSDEDAFYPAQTSSPNFGVFMDHSGFSDESSFDSSQLFFPGSVCSESILTRQCLSSVDCMLPGEFDASLQLSDTVGPDCMFPSLMRSPLSVELTSPEYLSFDSTISQRSNNWQDKPQRLPVFTRLSSNS